MVGEQDRRKIGAPGVFGAGRKGVEQGGVEDERLPSRGSKAASVSAALLVRIPGPATTASASSASSTICLAVGRRETAVAGFGEADDHRFGHGEGEVRRGAGDGGDLELAGAGAHRAVGGEQRAAGRVAASGDDQDLAVLVLVAAFDRRQREFGERGAGQRGGPAHRVPAIASGAEVLAAPSFSSGAP